ncbi:hypothetical protein Ahia01_001281900 [Argonauta hians]
MSSNDTKVELLRSIRDSIASSEFTGPYGARQVLYLDYIASGRSLSFIEDYIRNEVLPEYGNTHTTTSTTSLQTTLYRHEARDIIRNATNASEHDAVIFVGSGTTAAVHKLIFSLDLKEPPVIFAGPFEHHSNLLPWREIGSQVIAIRTTSEGCVDIEHLEQKLKEYTTTTTTMTDCCPQLIGCFSAASNITGILTDVDAISACLHRYGALALWDYATAGPYLNIDMNPVVPGRDHHLVYKDAVYFSPHKFIGGVSTPGVLVAKKRLFKNPVPEGCGGGTIFFVRRDSHRYLHEPEMREEGGTPDIVGSIRAGLCMQLKLAVGTDFIAEREACLARRAAESWKGHKNLVILGSNPTTTTTTTHRLPIYSFLVQERCTGLYLHHNYVAALLNDVFGIQSRGGCACAGPYAEHLLGLSEEMAAQYERILLEDSRLDRVHLRRYREYSPLEILRPGFTRLNLPYFMDDKTLDYVLEALQLVADYGWLLLPQYRFNPETGEWRHKDLQVYKDRKWLGNISYTTGTMVYSGGGGRGGGQREAAPNYEECLREARILFKNAEKTKLSLPDQTLLFPDHVQQLRWFVLPCEAYTCITAPSSVHHTPPHRLPFTPLGADGGVSSGGGGGGVNGSGGVGVSSSGGGGVSGGGDGDGVGVNGSGDGSSSRGGSCTVNGSGGGFSSNSDDGSCSSSSGPVSGSGGDRGGGRGSPRQSEEFFRSIQDFLERGFSFADPDRPGTTTPHTNSVTAATTTTTGGGGVTSHNTKTGLNDDASGDHVGLSDDSHLHDNHIDLSPKTSLNKQTVSDSPKTILNKQTVSDSPKTSLNKETTSPSHKTSLTIDTSSLKEDTISYNPKTSLKGDKTSLNSAFELFKLKSSSRFLKSPETTTTTTAAANDESVWERVGGVSGMGTEGGDRVPSPTPDHHYHHDNNNNNNNNEGSSSSGGGRASPSSTPTTNMSSTSSPSSSSSLPGESGGGAPPVCCPRVKPRPHPSHPGTNNNNNKKKKKAGLWVSPPKELFSPVVEAITEHSMIKHGDRVLLCLSGGKDSLSMLHIIRQYQFYARGKGVQFEVGAVTVDPETPSYNPLPLKKYLSCLGVPYYYESQGILAAASSLPYQCDSICSYCSRMKRGRIYLCARREGYNVVAMGQHLDDLAESFLMSVFHNGILRTMKCHYTVQEKDLRLIRPLVYVREKNLRAFAEKNQLPVISENCPACFEAPKERHRMKQLLASQEVLFPNIYHSLRAAMAPIMAINRTGLTYRHLLATGVAGCQQEEEEDE